MVPTNGGLYNTESKNLIFWHLDFLNAGGITCAQLPCGAGGAGHKVSCSGSSARTKATLRGLRLVRNLYQTKGGTRDKPYIPPLRRHTGAKLTSSGAAFRNASAAKWRCRWEHGHGFRCTHGSPGEHRAFLGVFSRPGWLYTRQTHLIGPKDAFDRRFGSAGRPHQGIKACLVPARTPK